MGDDRPYEEGEASIVLPGVTTNTTSIAYSPLHNLYYVAQAGSSSYKLWTYNAEGEKVATMHPVGIDCRGLWWNTASNELQVNAYNSHGYFVFEVDAQGYPTSQTRRVAGKHQPDSDSNLCYDPDNDELLGVFRSQLHRYSPSTGEELGTIPIDDCPPNVNSVFCGYSGIPSHEIVLLDAEAKLVYYVDKFSGKVADTKTKIPLEAGMMNKFNTGYANGKLFIIPTGGSSFQGFQIVSEGLAACSFGNLPPK